MLVSFPWMDVWSDQISHSSSQRKCKSKKPTRFWLTVISVLIFFQVVGVFVYYVTISLQDNLPPEHFLPSYRKGSLPLDPKGEVIRTIGSELRQSNHVMDFSRKGSNPTQKEPSNRNLPLPRVLIGIVTAANKNVAKVYRSRQRRLFELWKELRICTLYEFEYNVNQARTNCQVIYTFVMGVDSKEPRLTKIHNTSMELTSMLLNDTIRPLLVNKSTFSAMSWYNEILQQDVTLLNIKENMNQGKTPTFFYFASQVAQRYHIPYIMKCDSDAILRLTTLLQFLDSQLPLSIPTRPPTTGNIPLSETPPVMIGSFVHKTPWKRKADETFWKDQYHNGLHVYLAGQCYMISTNLALELVHEARRIEQMPYKNISYLEGHEDHDASAMIEVGRHYRYRSQNPNKYRAHTPLDFNNNTDESMLVPMRWIHMAKHYRFWEHPVKGVYLWLQICKEEETRKKEAEDLRPSSLSSSAQSPQSQSTAGIRGEGATDRSQPRILLIILGATTRDIRQRHRQRYQQESLKQYATCPIHQVTMNCTILYMFPLGGNPNGPTEQVSKESAPLRMVTDATYTDEPDVVLLNIRYVTMLAV